MATDMIKSALAAGRNALDEWESKQLFAAYGIAVPDGDRAIRLAGQLAGFDRDFTVAKLGGK